MGCCSALNCSNRSDRKRRFKLHRFPSDPDRRKLWTLNCGRKNWTPGPGAFLCEAHFDNLQFEWSRADGRRKLKPNAVPTIFSVPEDSDTDTPSDSKSTEKSDSKAPYVIYLCSTPKEEVSPDTTSDSAVPDEQYLMYASVSIKQES